MASTQSNGLRLSTANETIHTGRQHIIKTSENPNRKSQIYEQDLSLPRIKTTQNEKQGKRVHQMHQLPVHQTLRSSGGFDSMKSNKVQTNNASTTGIIRQADRLEQNRIILFKKGKQLSKYKDYIVEISTNSEQTLFIAAYDIETPESLLIELPEPKSTEILTQFQQDYDLLASSLQVHQKRLVLLNPKFVKKSDDGPDDQN